MTRRSIPGVPISNKRSWPVERNAKGRKDIASILNEKLSENIVVRVGDRRRSISKLEAMIEGALDNAVRGDPHALQIIFRLDQMLKASAPAQSYDPEQAARSREFVNNRLEQMAQRIEEARIEEENARIEEKKSLWLKDPQWLKNPPLGA